MSGNLEAAAGKETFTQHVEDMSTKVEETAHEAAERGHAATDQYGRPLVHFDPTAESRLRWKLDLYTIPTVSLLYLFCFIDRANIGMLTSSSRVTMLTSSFR